MSCSLNCFDDKNVYRARVFNCCSVKCRSSLIEFVILQQQPLVISACTCLSLQQTTSTAKMSRKKITKAQPSIAILYVFKIDLYCFRFDAFFFFPPFYHFIYLSFGYLDNVVLIVDTISFFFLIRLSSPISVLMKMLWLTLKI